MNAISPLVTERAVRIADGKQLPATHGRIQDWAFGNKSKHERILDGLADPYAVEILNDLSEEIASAMSRDIPDAQDAIELARVREALVTGIAIAAVRKWQQYQVNEINSPDVW